MHEKLMEVGRDMFEVQRNIDKAEELALEVMRLSRNSLLINLRFLDQALVRFIPADSGCVTDTIATDGRYMFINPTCILRRYKANERIPTRDYLHVTLHCIFRHLFINKKVNAELWDLSCDIAVENAINGLDLQMLFCPRCDRQAALIEKLKSEIGLLTAEKLYRYFSAQDMPAGEAAHLRAAFVADDHSIWHDENTENMNGEQENDETDDGDDDGNESDTDGGDEEQTAPDDKSEEEDGNEAGEFTGEESDEGGGGAGNGDKRDGEGKGLDELERLWRDISERIQVDIGTSSSTWGQAAGDMTQQLAAVNREKCDYTEFLKRFSVLGENMEVNDDEFDYIFYTYGLELFGNMPLIEPLEYKEVKKIREFVIALDTSESVEGETVQKFVTKTYNILKQSGSFFTKTNIHIIQCGAAVTEDAKITSDDDFDEYMRHMKLKGFGGTDFRPAFEYVDRLIAEKELADLRGIIYFTDGYGTFPVKKPGYDAAFVFVDSDDIPEIPVWGIKVLLTKDDIELF